MPKPDKSQIKEDLQGKPVLLEEYNSLEKPVEDLGKYTNFYKNYEYFHIMGHEESHLLRRRKILKDHPEVKILFGSDQASLWVTLACNTILYTSAALFQNLNWFSFLITAYVIGGTFTHTCQILVHDLTHFTCFQSFNLNRVLAILANLPTGFPTAIMFGRYHSEHHTYMNIQAMDPDIPSTLELNFLTTPFRKFLFLLFQPIIYALRPVFKRPKVPGIWECINIASIILANKLTYCYLGPNALYWLLISSLMGMSLHPCSGHVIAEHYEFQNRLETYDYIGPMNFFNLNLGYHTEHHDFPMVPWTRLPMIRKLCPEYYECLPIHTSYLKVFYDYIFDQYMGPWSRIIRKTNSEEKLE